MIVWLPGHVPTMATIDGKPLNSLRVVDLKEELNKRGLSKSGAKKELVDRLSQYLTENGEDGDAVVGEEAPVGSPPNVNLAQNLAENDMVQEYLRMRQTNYESTMSEVVSLSPARKAAKDDDDEEEQEEDRQAEEATKKDKEQHEQGQERERVAEEETLKEKERRAAEKAQKEKEHLAEEQAQAEKKRQAAESAQKEKEQRAAEKAQKEKERLAEEQAQKAKERRAAEQAQAEKEKLEKEKRLAEEARKAKKKLEEETRKEKQRLEEDKRVAAVAQRKEQERQEEEARKEKEKRAAAEAQKEKDKLAKQAEKEQLVKRQCEERDRLAQQEERDRLAKEAKLEHERIGSLKQKEEEGDEAKQAEVANKEVTKRDVNSQDEEHVKTAHNEAKVKGSKSLEEGPAEEDTKEEDEIVVAASPIDEDMEHSEDNEEGNVASDARDRYRDRDRVGVVKGSELRAAEAPPPPEEVTYRKLSRQSSAAAAADKRSGTGRGKRGWGKTSRSNSDSAEKRDGEEDVLLTVSSHHLKDIVPDIKPFLEDMNDQDQDQIIMEIEEQPSPERKDLPVPTTAPALPVTTTGKPGRGATDGTGTDGGRQHKASKDTMPVNSETTSVICVRHLVRPFTITQLRELLKRTGTIADFWIDKIKSTALVEYSNQAQAEETLMALDGVKWPNVNPKTLAVTFSSKDLLERAKTDNALPGAPQNSSSSRDERLHKDSRDRDLRRKRSRSPKEQDPPAGKQAKVEHAATDSESRPKVSLDTLFKKTKTLPCIYWQPKHVPKQPAALVETTPAAEPPPPKPPIEATGQEKAE